MPDWPQEIPEDLRAALEALDDYRYLTKDQDRWGVIREWLVKH